MISQKERQILYVTYIYRMEKMVLIPIAGQQGGRHEGQTFMDTVEEGEVGMVEE